jgi:hypothetical protein
MFGDPGLADRYFQSYVPRIKEQLAQDDRPITALTHADYHYIQWYLKGSWALWDLEASTGRTPLMRALGDLYRKHAGQKIDYATFANELASSLGSEVHEHLRHWFKQGGFAPVHRRS